MREAAAVDVIDEFRATLFDNLAVDEHVDLVDLELLEDARVVGDDQAAVVLVVELRAAFGASTAIWKISFFFFSPPEKPTFM